MSQHLKVLRDAGLVTDTKNGSRHRGFHVHGDAGAAMRDSVGGDGGWRSLLELYRHAA